MNLRNPLMNLRSAHAHSQGYATRGLTLVELLVVVVIVGLLSAVAVPNYFKQVRRARYAQASSDMSGMQKAILIYLSSEGQFPPDVNEGIVPTDVLPLYADSWPTTGPYGAAYDYEEWNVGSTGCYIQFTFFGQNVARDTLPNVPIIPGGGLEQFDDDLILSLGQQRSGLCPS